MIRAKGAIPMMAAWWLFWMMFMFLLLVPSVTYGWGYRRWGPPYPRYIQRRRGMKVGAADRSVALGYQSWGWGGDFVWTVLLIGTVWACVALWWR
jgi:hypothetical protein